MRGHNCARHTRFFVFISFIIVKGLNKPRSVGNIRYSYKIVHILPCGHMNPKTTQNPRQHAPDCPFDQSKSMTGITSTLRAKYGAYIKGSFTLVNVLRKLRFSRPMNDTKGKRPVLEMQKIHLRVYRSCSLVYR